MRNITKTLATCIIPLALAACGSDDDTVALQDNEQLVTTPIEQLVLQQTTSCEELREYAIESIADQFIANAYPYPICLDCEPDVMPPPPGEPVMDSAPTDDSFDDYTTTNSQEAGVDELDLVETDVNGNFYLVDGHYLVIANGLPPEDLREIAALQIMDSGYVNGLLLDESVNRLVVVASGTHQEDSDVASMLGSTTGWVPLVEVFFIDVSNPAEPAIQKQLLFEGYQIAARRIDSRVHLISHSTPPLPWSLYSDSELTALLQQYQDAVMTASSELATLEQQIRERISELLLQVDINTLLPQMLEKTAGGAFVNVPNISCEVSKPAVSSYLAFTSITSVDSDGQNLDNLITVNNAWNVYASQNNLYLFQPSSSWWWDTWQREQTAIYKFAIGGGAAEYRAMGTVTGTATSSFQFSEFEDHLRVAANRTEFDPATGNWTQDNHLFVLAENAATGMLDMVGSVEGFGKDESIFSARFLGERGFVVTFRMIDPLFAFDLSDPNNPMLMGELEIPGVSTYMHPLDENHLLTIGFDGDMTGLTPGFQLQIFNVQDLTSPQLLHAYSPVFTADGFSWSTALWNHLAFNYFDSAGILTIPVQYWSSDIDQDFSGFASFSVDIDAGFSELGRLDHSDLARLEYCIDPTADYYVYVCDNGAYLEAAVPLRSVIGAVDDQVYIYTFSNAGIKASNAGDFGNPLATLPLNYPSSYWWWLPL